MDLFHAVVHDADALLLRCTSYIVLLLLILRSTDLSRRETPSTRPTRSAPSVSRVIQSWAVEGRQLTDCLSCFPLAGSFCQPQLPVIGWPFVRLLALREKKGSKQPAGGLLAGFALLLGRLSFPYRITSTCVTDNTMPHPCRPSLVRGPSFIGALSCCG